MLIRNYTPVTEAYFGKSKDLLEVEKLIQVIVDRFTVPFKQVGHRILDAVKVNKSKENKKIEELLCKQFGFKEMVLHWDGSNVVNAYTVTHGILKLADDSEPALPLANGDGTYYDSKHKYICVVNVYAGLVDAKVNAEEITACILHEIGHNFVCTPVVNVVSMVEWAMLPVNIYMSVKEITNVLGAWDKLELMHNDPTLKDPSKEAYVAKKVSKILLSALVSVFKYLKIMDFIQHDIYSIFYAYQMPDIVKKWFEQMDEYLIKNKNTVLAKWDEYVKAVEKAREEFKKNPHYLTWGTTISLGLDLSSVFFYGNVLMIEHFMDNLSGYSNEIFADSFATAYGYGSATVSLQKKLEYYFMDNRALDKRNKYNVYNQYIYIMNRLMLTFLDEHPATQTRMKKQIEKLKEELNDPNVDPRIRKVMLKDLEKSEKIYDEYVNTLPPNLKHLAVIMNYAILNEKYFGGKMDLREPVNRVLNAGKDMA